MIPAIRDLAAQLCKSIVDAGEVARLGIFLCDIGDGGDPGAVITTRAGLVAATIDVAKTGGIVATTEFLAQITDTPAWKVPIVFLENNRLRVAQYTSKRGVG